MEIDTLLLDLRMESIYIRELLAVKWLYDSGLVENMERVVEEYRQSRQLLVCMKGKANPNPIRKGELWGTDTCIKKKANTLNHHL